jgi:glycerol-3-phosphate dehydrogenase
MQNSTKVMVVGGGANGVGIIRDLALRGIDAVLVEQQDLAHGASFRFHGLLHSGARYVVKDRTAATDCVTENQILGRIAPTCVGNCGGLFLQLNSDPDDYVEKWLAGCAVAGIATQEVKPTEVRREIPCLTAEIKRAYTVADGTIDGARLVWTQAYQAMRYGARVLTYTKVTGLCRSNGKITGAEVLHTLTGEKSNWECELGVRHINVFLSFLSDG